MIGMLGGLDEHAWITASEAHHSLNIPAGSIRSWASGTNPCLYARGTTRDGAKLYAISDLIELAATRRRRAPHTRPRRAVAASPNTDIASTC